jgi:probable rRNA maturation factor
MPISVRKPPSFPAVTAPLRAIVTGTLALEALRPGEIALWLTDDAALRELNRRWRGLDRATDVLSFPYGIRAGRVSGDLVISIDRLLEQAKRFRTGPARELTRLVVHGTLHLAGHDHHAAGERRRMRRIEARALCARGAWIAKNPGLERSRRWSAQLARRRKGKTR